MTIVTNPPAPENWGAAPEFRPIPFADLRAELLALYEPPQRAKATYTSMVKTCAILAAALGPDALTSALAPPLIARLIKERPPHESPNTTHSLLVRVRVVCNYALAQGYVRSTPFGFRKQWVRKVAPKEQKHHGAEEITKVLDLARQDVGRKKAGSWSQWRARRLYALVATVAYTGLRKMEALKLRVEDIDIPGRMILIVAREGNRLKTAKSAQPVPMPDDLAAILAEWIPYLAIPADWPDPPAGRCTRPASNPQGTRDAGWLWPNAYRTGPWTGGGPMYRPEYKIKRLGERAGVEGFTFKSLRHSFATHGESRWGFSEALLQRILRHTNRSTQQFYRHADAANLKAAVRGIGFGHVPPVPAPDVAPPAPPPVAPASAAPRPKRSTAPRNGKPPGPSLTDDQAAEARRLRAEGWNYERLMDRYGIAKSTLNALLTGKTYRHVGPVGDVPGGMEPTP